MTDFWTQTVSVYCIFMNEEYTFPYKTTSLSNEASTLFYPLFSLFFICNRADAGEWFNIFGGPDMSL